MLISAIVLYLLLTVYIGYRSSRSISNVDDFVFAGRSLPMYLATPALFATWFGAETVLGASAEFAQKGVEGIIEEPLGAALCLLLVGLFFARPFYRLNLMTFGDYYRIRYGKLAELISAALIAASYFGWIAAQFVALGVVLSSVLGLGVISGIFLGAAVVLIYTYIGGMWAISVTDFMQTIIIIIGLIVVCWYVIAQAGGLEVVLTQKEGFYDFSPRKGHFWEYVAAWITIGLGSIPQQDIYQRIVSCRTERIAIWSSVLGALLYLTISLLPLLAAVAAKKAYPNLNASDPQLLIPTTVKTHFGWAIQALFFGALISAIMSTASAASLAAATVVSENIVRPLWKSISQQYMLGTLRLSLVAITFISVGMAISGQSIIQLAASSSAFSLVSLFVPLVLGLLLRRVSTAAGLISMMLGLIVWLWAGFWFEEFPPVVIGLAASFMGFWIGMLIKDKKTILSKT